MEYFVLFIATYHQWPIPSSGQSQCVPPFRSGNYLPVLLFPLRKFQQCAIYGRARQTASRSKAIWPIACWLALQLAKYPLALSQLAFYQRPFGVDVLLEILRVGKPKCVPSLGERHYWRGPRWEYHTWGFCNHMVILGMSTEPLVDAPVSGKMSSP